MGAHAFLAAGRYPHGTRARYVAENCHCKECRAANRIYYQERRTRSIAQLVDVVPNGPPVEKTFLKRDSGGHMKLFRYPNCCPGVLGVACPTTAFLRNDAKVCRACGDRATVWNGYVSADKTRKHLLKLRRQGIGYKTVADAADVAHTVLGQILAKKKRRIRAVTERRVLAVDKGARADHAVVSGKGTRELIDKLIGQGFTRARLAILLGYKRGALQLLYGRGPVLARTELKVKKLYRQLTAEQKTAREEPELFEAPLEEGWKRRLVDAYLAGVPLTELCGRFGKSADALSQILRRAGVARPRDREDADAR